MEQRARYRLAHYWLAGLLFLALIEGAAAQSKPRRVFVLHSFGQNFAPWNAIALQLREELIKQSASAIDFSESSLQSERLTPTQDPQPFLAYLHTLLANRDIDLAIAIGAPAARFFLQNRSALLPDTPLLIAGAETRAFDHAALRANDVAVAHRLDLGGQIEAIRRVLPDVNHVAVVMGDSELERFWLREVKTAFQPFEPQISFEWLNKLPLDDVASHVASLPRHSAIFYASFLVDAHGISHEGDRVIRRLREADQAPIFTFIDTSFGQGIVGGPMISTRDLARRSAEVAVRILNGAEDRNTKVITVDASTPAYDWRELQRWSIREDRLPEGSPVHFREPGVWELYRLQIMAISSALLVQAGLISWLIYEHRRRNLAEVQSRGLLTELTHMNRVATAGELSASIAHEINQPLTGMLARASAAVRWLAADPPDLGKVRELLLQIVNAGDRAGEVIASIRAMFAKDRTERRPVDLKELIPSVLGLVRLDLQKSGIEFSVHFGEPPLVVHGDKTQLQQVVLNLVINAIEAMHAGEARVLRLDCDHRDASTLFVSIEDTGCGIDAEHLKRIFDPLFTTKQHGMGMGLSICRSIIESHGGRIRAARAASGGSVFSFDLPVWQGDSAVEPEVPRRPATSAPPRPEREPLDTDRSSAA